MKFYFAATFGLALLITSCVTKGSYDQLLSEKLATDEELKSTKSELANSQRSEEEMREHVAQLQEQGHHLRNTNQLLVNKNSGLSGTLQATRTEVVETEKNLASTAKTYDDLLQSLRQEISDQQATIQKMQAQTRVVLLESLIFPAGATEPDDAAKKVLNKLAKQLKKIGNQHILIEGNSDPDAPSGSLKERFPSNWELSAWRATSVVRYLISKGVDAKKISAVANAEFQKPERRIEIILMPDLPKSEK